MSRSPRHGRAKPSGEGLAYAGERSSGNEIRSGRNRTVKGGGLQFLAYAVMPIILVSQGHIRVEFPGEGGFLLVTGLMAAATGAVPLKRVRRS